MLLGRFAMIVPIVALAGGLAAKKATPASVGSFPTHGPMFVALLAGTILIVGGLTFFPALALGPIVEHLLMIAGQTFCGRILLRSDIHEIGRATCRERVCQYV